MLLACIPGQGCSLRCCRCYRSVSLRAQIWMGNGCATWRNLQVQSRRLLRTTAVFRYMQMRLGFNYGPIPLDIPLKPLEEKKEETSKMLVF